jgi:hypothetical protein
MAIALRAVVVVEEGGDGWIAMGVERSWVYMRPAQGGIL